MNTMEHRWVFCFFLWCACLSLSSLATWEDQVELVVKDCGDTEVRCMLKAHHLISEWLQFNNMYTILMAGKLGTGKTRLIKGLSRNLTVVDVYEDKDLFPKTIKVEPHHITYENVKMTFYDSPGLADTEFYEERGYDHFIDMIKKNIFPDVLVVFVRMDSVFYNALDAEDEYVIRKISNDFGLAKWRYAMFVLSFANKVENIDAEERGDVDDELYFSQTLADKRLHIKKLLFSLGVEKEVIRQIPIIPVGLVNEPKLMADVREVSWVDEFWSLVLKILKRFENRQKPMKASFNEDSTVTGETKEHDDDKTAYKRLDEL